MPISPEIITQFTKIVGEPHIVWPDEQMAEYYASDQTGNLSGAPQWVIFPATTEEVSAIVKLCYQHHIPILLRGGASNVTGATVPTKECLILSTKRLNNIIEVNPIDRLIIAESGVLTKDLQEEVKKYHLEFPQNIGSAHMSFIGGNVAVSSGSPRSLKYGTTKDYVMNLEVVLPNGEIIWTGNNVTKDATGYNLTQLFSGSEGTLGIITKVVLKLIPANPYKCVTIIPFQNSDHLFQAIDDIFLNGLNPVALEFADQEALPFIQKQAPQLFDYTRFKSFLWIELDANCQAALDHEMEVLTSTILKDHPAALSSSTPEEFQQYWQLRMKLGFEIQAYSAFRDVDMVVPRSQVKALYQGIQALSKLHQIRCIAFAHIGNGNLHVNVLKESLTDAEWEDKLKKTLQAIYTLATSLGGSVSGEHGIGVIQKAYAQAEILDQKWKLMHKIKQAIDPLQLINSGILFTD